MIEIFLVTGYLYWASMMKLGSGSIPGWPSFLTPLEEVMKGAWPIATVPTAPSLPKSKTEALTLQLIKSASPESPCSLTVE